MNLKAIDKDIQELIKKRSQLQKLNYNNPKYDELEEQLHEGEDAFQEAYGEYLEEIFQEVHEAHCPDTDVLMPIAYIAKKYVISENGQYSVDSTEGIYVETEKYPEKDTKLVIIPNPLRIVLNISHNNQEVVWDGKDQ